MTKDKILELRNGALIDFYEESINIFKKHKMIKCQINTLENSIINCNLKITILYVGTFLIFPFVATCLSLISGLIIINIINFFIGEIYNFY